MNRERVLEEITVKLPSWFELPWTWEQKHARLVHRPTQGTVLPARIHTRAQGRVETRWPNPN